MERLATEIRLLVQALFRHYHTDITRRGAVSRLWEQIEDTLDALPKKGHTKPSISQSTLKRLCGKETYRSQPGIRTLDTLALLAGYPSYAQFLETLPATSAQEPSLRTNTPPSPTDTSAVPLPSTPDTTPNSTPADGFLAGHPGQDTPETTHPSARIALSPAIPAVPAWQIGQKIRLGFSATRRLDLTHIGNNRHVVVDAAGSTKKKGDIIHLSPDQVFLDVKPGTNLWESPHNTLRKPTPFPRTSTRPATTAPTHIPPHISTPPSAT